MRVLDDAFFEEVKIAPQPVAVRRRSQRPANTRQPLRSTAFSDQEKN
jgi:hypothetical protein